MPRKGMLPPQQSTGVVMPSSVDASTVVDTREIAPGVRARDVDVRLYSATEYEITPGQCETVGDLREILVQILADLPPDDTRLSEAYLQDNRLRVTLAEGVTR